MKILIAISIVIALTSAGLAQPRQIKIKLRKNPDAMKSEIERLIPIGTDVSTARRIMEANKFICQPLTNYNFTTGTEDKPGEEYKNVDFLSCELHKSTLAGFINPRRLFYMREWKIAFVKKNDVITDILVYVGWFCDL